MTDDRANAIAEQVRAELGARADALRSSTVFRGELTLTADRDGVLDVLRILRDTPGLDFNFPVDIAGVDYLGHPQPPQVERYAVVYHLLSWQTEERIRVRAPVPEDDPVCPSACGLWSLANWTEREIYDMLGVRFTDHPDLRRILMWEGFTHHPLRKDYPLKGLGERGSFPRMADDFPDAARSRRQPSKIDREFEQRRNT